MERSTTAYNYNTNTFFMDWGYKLPDKKVYIGWSVSEGSVLNTFLEGLKLALRLMIPI